MTKRGEGEQEILLGQEGLIHCLPWNILVCILNRSRNHVASPGMPVILAHLRMRRNRREFEASLSSVVRYSVQQMVSGQKLIVPQILNRHKQIRYIIGHLSMLVGIAFVCSLIQISRGLNSWNSHLAQFTLWPGTKLSVSMIVQPTVYHISMSLSHPHEV